jgi:hypothetical protein
MNVKNVVAKTYKSLNVRLQNRKMLPDKFFQEMQYGVSEFDMK